MRLVHVRNRFFDDTTIGTLLVESNGGSWMFCDTLEDADRYLELYPERKIDGATAIPRGEREVADTFSQRFGRKTLQLLDVPGFTGIRIHAGNSHVDTEGCILLGSYDGGRRVTGSRDMVDALYGLVSARLAAGERVTWITH